MTHWGCLLYDSTRVNLVLFQHDVNVIWDLAVHDLSIMDYILPRYRSGLSDGYSHVTASKTLHMSVCSTVGRS